MTAARCAAALLALAISASAPAFADAQEPAEARGPSCLRLTDIESSSVIDRQHIAFRMRDGRTFVNNMPYPCLGLRRDTAWLHRTSMAEVCDLDIITVLNNIGGGFMPGASCGLGRFELVTPSELEALKAAAKAAREQ
jgi:hypothetical protein